MAQVRGKRPPHGEPVLDKAFALLRAFTPDRAELNLTELSARTGIPLSTTRRLAVRLVALGALEHTADGRYAIGVGLWEIASLAPRGLGLRASALPYMEDLYEVTHQHVLLAVPDDAEAVLVERISGRTAVDVLYHVGGRLPLRATGVGLVLLANAESETQEGVLAQVSGAERIGLRRRLASARREGAVVFRPGPPWPVVSVAAPIHGAGGSVVAALSVIVPEPTRQNPRNLVAAVRLAARRISRDMQS
ncbi:IclR family transcriptional regulator [Halostreptopolyspora alba]|uniref:IclR family transcriptional regulator n=1 Tax=Halostreptopolyspora alba TaxID=2487137 RepID=A0A3N0EI31_9ACTN|nr:IclR family transcriptional regulator [Nocardiopsaceae bacterium YIM 96095]